MVDTALEGRLQQFVAVERVLVCVDYDGTLAPIVDDPTKAGPAPGAMTALAKLNGEPGVTVAIVTGRSLAGLHNVVDLPEGVLAVGSHGSEFVAGEFAGLGSGELELLDELIGLAEAIVAQVPGATMETKPTSIALHTRNAGPAETTRTEELAQERILQLPGIFVTKGKEVIEVAVVHADKGTACRTLADNADADSILFLGDDVTDERAFGVLTTNDVGVKVGPGPTKAEFRIADPAEVVELLDLVASWRRGD